MLARLANDANVRTQADDLPFIAATWMRLAEPHHIAHLNIHHHRAAL
jgi:hypothetical protein